MPICILILMLLINFSVRENPLFELSSSAVNRSAVKSEIVFIGDSSLASAVDSDFFSSLSGKSAVILNLTADGHGIAGLYNLIRHVFRNNSNVKDIVLMISPHNMTLEFSVGGYCSTLGDLDSIDAISLGLIDSFTCFKFLYFNSRGLVDYWKQILADKYVARMDFVKTFKNGGLSESEISEHYVLPENTKGFDAKWKEFALIDGFAGLNELNVVLMYGPLHSEYFRINKQKIYEKMRFLKKFEHLKIVEDIVTLPSSQMGNHVVHVDILGKKNSTSLVFLSIRNLLE